MQRRGASLGQPPASLRFKQKQWLIVNSSENSDFAAE